MMHASSRELAHRMLKIQSTIGRVLRDGYASDPVPPMPARMASLLAGLDHVRPLNHPKAPSDSVSSRRRRVPD
jgi:hypothetical protein